MPPSSNRCHVETLGVRRSGFGNSGRELKICVNAFKTTIPRDIIHHYDVIAPADKALPARLNMELIRALQERIAPDVFTPPGVYDGRKNFFTARKLSLGPDNTREASSIRFDVTLDSPDEAAAPKPGAKGPKVYKIRLNLVATINPEVLQRFIEGKQSHDNAVLTAITPSMKYPFNVRSFFTDQERKDIGSGLELWRGYFQSVRPGNQPDAGSLISLCLDFFGRGGSPDILAPSRGLPERERMRLQRFISGIRVMTPTPGGKKIARVIKKLSSAGASALSFQMKEGGTMTVRAHPDVICVEIGTGALIPLELCEVPPGQIMRKQVPPEKTKSVLDFATKRPQARLDSIKAGLRVLAYGQSEYVREFGMNVPNSAPMSISARVLAPPALKYGPGSRQLTITPANGAWNMREKRFFKPVEIPRWALVVYERQQRFNSQNAADMIKGLCESAREVGINMGPTSVILWQNGQGDIEAQLRAAGKAVVDKYKGGPNLIVVVLPEGGNEIYTAVKHFGDVTMGVATQCLKSSKCFRAKAQYFANVCLKINVKLGGINAVPDPKSVQTLADPNNPTIVMGADVIHPAPGSDGRPSFTSLVASVDSNNAKYVAECAVQTSRQEIIENLETMAFVKYFSFHNALNMYINYRKNVEKKSPQSAVPKRIIFYRDGVSEGQFKQVLEQELTALKKACTSLGINTQITFIVVGKRHHIRFFPANEREGDQSGNCPAGTVVDREIGHPTELDFYLQSHGGLLGTSRPAHYSILHDENKFSPDALQSLSFALCHVYARSTRSVSIPAPVYYADIVCSRAKNHYDPKGNLDFSDSATNVDSNQGQASLEAFRKNFKPLNPTQKFLMYFSLNKSFTFYIETLPLEASILEPDRGSEEDRVESHPKKIQVKRDERNEVEEHDLNEVGHEGNPASSSLGPYRDLQ
ncbi:argonaute-like protein [Gymnopus androsaceus JB14]|uniref:Argonaute-like protein n=1 Tax=Gymnopus androsaceus JB14 TaxID=1447944 RepID=A0A6A4HMV9_9AGAR|nr:argonaute-like protein [Gymnopus androsaceus JB14]